VTFQMEVQYLMPRKKKVTLSIIQNGGIMLLEKKVSYTIKWMNKGEELLPL
jgi:hypothetical protein